jgi:1-acyl-sn-glycerol-3-phosphate acyltransferase
MIKNLRRQSWIGQLNFFWHGTLWVILFRAILRYRCAKLKSLRQQIQQIMDEYSGDPILICCNHLTLIDSMILNWLLTNPMTYNWNFRKMPWNVPELRNFGRNPVLRLMCYLGKCIFVERGGSIKARKQTFQQLRTLLEQNQVVCIFPEGGRTRTGKFDQDRLTNGAARLATQVPNTKILCLYLRSDKQKGYSKIPPRGSLFSCSARLLQRDPPPPYGLGTRTKDDAVIALTSLIGTTIAALEQEHFAKSVSNH